MEVELKFHADDFASIEAKYDFNDPAHIVDWYYEHPCRKLEDTDEWLRVRHVQCGKNPAVEFITYKGPASQDGIGLKSPYHPAPFPTKSGPVREELEFVTSPTQYTNREGPDYQTPCGHSIMQILDQLGFTHSVMVDKIRRETTIPLPHDPNRQITICLDEVRDLGKFVELEVIAERYDYLDLDKQTLYALAAELGLTQLETRGYARMTLYKPKVK